MSGASRVRPFARGVCLALGLLLALLAPAQARVQLTVQTYHAPGTATAVAFDYVLERFQEAHPDIEVTHIFVPFAELIPTLMRQAMVGGLPDVVFADNPDIRYLAKAGVLRDLTPLVERWGQWEDFFVGSRYATTWEDRVYAIHFSTNNLALFYNKELFREAGISEPPRTWEELLQVAQTLKARLSGRGIYAMGFSAIDSEEGTWQLLPFIWSNEGSLLQLNRPAAVEALRLWTTLVQEGYAPRDVMTWPQTAGVMEEFRAGRLAMMINGSWVIADLRKAGVEFGIAPLPVPRQGMTPIVPMGGETLGVSATADPAKVEAAWKLITFFAEPKMMAEYCIRSARVPTRGSAVPLVTRQDPALAVFAELARVSVPRPVMGGDEKYTTVSAITRRYMQLAVGGALSPEAAFSRAAEEVRALFATDQEYQAALAQAEEMLSQVLTTR